MKELWIKLNSMKYFRLILFSLFGFIGGYLYYYFIGCYNGSCPITSKWYTSSLYGMLIGAIAGFPTKTNTSSENKND